jgi:hypothetical protein
MIEEQIEKSFYNTTSEKSFIDKLLAKDDVNAVRELIKKDRLTRQDMTELLYLLSSNETKLLNYGEWDRYVIMKFFVWIREFFKVNESLFDYKDELLTKENTCKNCMLFINTKNETNKCKCSTKKEDYEFNIQAIKNNIQNKYLKKEPIKLKLVQEPILILDENTKQIFENNFRLMEHNIKFLVDLYFNIGRTSLSLGGTGLLELLKNKFEVSYPNQQNIISDQQANRTGGIFRK